MTLRQKRRKDRDFLASFQVKITLKFKLVLSDLRNFIALGFAVKDILFCLPCLDHVIQEESFNALKTLPRAQKDSF